MQPKKDYEEKMEKTVSNLVNEYAAIRAGRANPAILNRIRVNYYGAPTPLTQMAAISVSEARILIIQPWDISTIKNIVKAINESDLGINPQNDGKVIRLAFPPLTEERRKELVKTLHKYAEDAKVAIRSIRRDAIENNKQLEKKSLITQDDLKDSEKAIQDLTDKYCKEIDETAKKKENEIMDI